MAVPIFSSRAQISAKKAEKLLKCYAERRSPKDTAKRTGLSLNTVYAQYERIRWRLVISGYYRDGAWSAEENGLAESVANGLTERRGVRSEDFYLHAAEAVYWADEHPPALTLKHLRKIIELSGPLDKQPVLPEAQTDKLAAYVRYARTELVYKRAQASAAENPDMEPYAQRAKEALDMEWRAYRTAAKALERARR